MEAESNDLIKCFGQMEIAWRHGNAGRHLHPALRGKHGSHAIEDRGEAAAAVLERAELVMCVADAIEAHGDREPVPLEEVAVVRREQRGVGGYGEAEPHAGSACFRNRSLGCRAQDVAIQQGLATEKRQIHFFAGGHLRIPELLNGDVTLEVECSDRLYLNGYIGTLATSGGLVSFMREQLGKPLPSPVVLGQITEKFREAVKALAEQYQIPMRQFDHKSNNTTGRCELVNGVIVCS